MDTKMPPSQTHETTIVNGFTQYLAPNVYSVHKSCCVCWEGLAHFLTMGRWTAAVLAKGRAVAVA